MKLNIFILPLILMALVACNQSHKENIQNVMARDTINDAYERAEIKEIQRDTAKLQKSEVPEAVLTNFYTDYPEIDYEAWYGYPDYDGRPWYDYDPTLRIQADPENYIVGFRQADIPYHVVYARSGNKLATHKKLNTDLPEAVSNAINKSEYKTWTLSEDKVEILKDRDGDQLKVYKLTETKGKEKHVLFYQADGKLLIKKKIQ